VTTPPRIALVGAGSMGSLHARVISQSPRAELAYVVEPNRAVGTAVAERYNAVWAPDLGSVRDVQACVIASATETHHTLGVEVLNRGLPLLMEKPLADRLADAEELVAVADKRDIPLVCGLLERYNPAIMTAMSVVEQARHVTAVRHSPYVARIGTGVSSDLLIHDVDAVLRIAGAEPSVVRGSFGYLHPDSQEWSEDVAETMMAFPNGMVANISASRISQRKVRRFEIAEQGRLIEIDMLRNSVTIYRHVLNEASQDGLTYRQQTIIEIPMLVSSQEPLAAQLNHFLDIVGGTADAAAERATILPPHRVVEAVRDDSAAFARTN
jgi:predicted dehydrogenase